MELRSQRTPSSDQPGDEPSGGRSSFSGIRESSRFSVRGAVERVHKAPLGSSAYQLLLWEAACIRQLFQRAERPQRGRESKARVAYGAERWASKKGTTPAPSTRAYKESARRFVTIPTDEFRTSYVYHELMCTLQRVEMEKRQRIPEDVRKYGALTEEQMGRRAKVRGLFALPCTGGGKKRMESVSRDLIAAISIRRCAVLKKRPAEQTRANFAGQPFSVEMYREMLKPTEAGRSRKTGRRLRVDIHLPLMIVGHCA